MMITLRRTLPLLLEKPRRNNWTTKGKKMHENGRIDGTESPEWAPGVFTVQLTR
jgi:hypothetical protein